jgi:hypothetical protein
MQMCDFEICLADIEECEYVDDGNISSYTDDTDIDEESVMIQVFLNKRITTLSPTPMTLLPYHKTTRIIMV